MSLSPAFTVSQSAASPNLVVLTDTSTGSDVLVTQRRIYIQNSDGDYIVPSGTSTDYIPWPLADNPISLNILTEDTAVNILVQWLNVSDTVLYDLDNNYPLVEYNKQFYYYLIQQQSLNPGIVQDTNYYSNLLTYYDYIINSINAINIGDDLAASQFNMNLATDMMNNQNYFF